MSSAGENDAARLSPEEYGKFCPGSHPVITPGQALAIRRFLNRQAAGHDF